MIAEHLFWLHFLGLRDPETDRTPRERASSPGAATTARGRTGGRDRLTLSTTIEAYVALKMAGVDAGDATRAYIAREGGVAKARVFTKCFLALLDAWPWQDIPTVPVEIVLAAAVGAALRLQLRVLGAPDARAALRRSRAAADEELRGRPDGDRRATWPERPAAPSDGGPAEGDGRRRAVGSRPAGGRRQLGRDPAAVGLVDRHARGARAGLRRSMSPEGDRRLERLPRRGRRSSAARGVPVADLGSRRSRCSAFAPAASPPTTHNSSGQASGCWRRR